MYALLKRIQHELCTLDRSQPAQGMAHHRRFVGATQTAAASDVVEILKNNLTPSALSRCSKEHLLFLGHENLDKCAAEHAMVFLQLQQLDPYVTKATLQEALVTFDLSTRVRRTRTMRVLGKGRRAGRTRRSPSASCQAPRT